MINPELEDQAKSLLQSFLENTISFLEEFPEKGLDESGRSFFVKGLVPGLQNAWQHFIGDFNRRKAQ